MDDLLNNGLDALTLGLSLPMRALPLEAVGASGEAIGRLVGFAGVRNNIKTRANLSRAGVVDVARACRRGWGHRGRTAFEMLWMFSRSPERIIARTKVQGWDDLAGAAAAGNGVLLVSAHTGNWEIVPVLAARAGVPVSVVARTLRASGLERRMVAWRRRGGVATLIRGAEGTSISAYRTLARGGILGCMMDRASSGPRILTPFLGGFTAVPEGPLALARRTGASIVLGMASRQGCLPTVVFKDLGGAGIRSSSEVAARIMGCIEEALGDQPEAWLWIHRRQPDGAGGSQSTSPPISASATSARSGTDGNRLVSRETVRGMASR